MYKNQIFTDITEEAKFQMHDRPNNSPLSLSLSLSLSLQEKKRLRMSAFIYFQYIASCALISEFTLSLMYTVFLSSKPPRHKIISY